MAKFTVQQMAEIWHTIEVEAANREEAIEIASEMLMNGEGSESVNGLEWTDEFWTHNEETGENQ